MASVPTDREGMQEATVGDLLRGLLRDVRLILQREAELAKLEVKDKGSRLGIAGGILAATVVVARGSVQSSDKSGARLASGGAAGRGHGSFLPEARRGRDREP